MERGALEWCTYTYTYARSLLFVLLIKLHLVSDNTVPVKIAGCFLYISIAPERYLYRYHRENIKSNLLELLTSQT